MPIPAADPAVDGVTATITGTVKLPGGTAPLEGTWYARIRTLNGATIDSDGTIRGGIQSVYDDGNGATMTLPVGSYEFRFESSALNQSTKQPDQFGWYPFDLEDDTLWGVIIETPVEVPVTPSDVALAQEAAAQAVAANEAAQQVGTTNDTVIAGRVNDDTSATRAALTRTGTKPVGRGEIVINVADYANAQAALDAAPAGSRVYFPAGVYAVPTGGHVLKSQRLTIDAMGAEFQVSAWGTPAFLALRANNAADDHTFRIGLVRYTGTRGNHTGTLLRGSTPYCSGCGVWSNGDRNTIEYLRTIGMPTPVFFASWDGTSAGDRMGYGNRIVNLEAEGYDFALLYVKQTAFDWGNAYCHDDIDDSGGANPTHAIYCSAAATARAGTGSVGRWITERNNGGHAYQFKYSDRLTFDSLIAHDSRGVLNIQDCDDLRGGRVSGTAMSAPPAGQGAVEFQWATAPSQRPSVSSITVSMNSGVNSRAVGLWVDDGEFQTINVTDNRSTDDPNAGALVLRGNRNKIGKVRNRQLGSTSKAALIGLGSADTADCTIRDVDSAQFLPVTVFAASIGSTWGLDGLPRAGAAPTTGTWQRGNVVFNSAPSASAPLGWMCVTAGTPGTWKALANISA